MKGVRDYSIAESVVKEALFSIDEIVKIKQSHPNDSLAFEFAGISQQIEKCQSKYDLAEVIVKTFGVSFECKLDADNYLEVSQEIFDELVARGIEIDQSL